MMLFAIPTFPTVMEKIYYGRDELELVRYRRQWVPILISFLLLVPDILLLKSDEEVNDTTRKKFGVMIKDNRAPVEDRSGLDIYRGALYRVYVSPGCKAAPGYRRLGTRMMCIIAHRERTRVGIQCYGYGTTYSVSRDRELLH
eukprot:650286-Amorphochlora_amoeboformis.AAC.1